MTFQEGALAEIAIADEDIADVASLGRLPSKRPLRLLVCGSVDDGKSTLIGRLLWDTKSVKDDQRENLLARGSRQNDLGLPDFALLLDGLMAEQEQGITIDVAWRYFSTARRSFIVADTPGHEQYTRNMATGASTAELAVILVDARKGVLEQTRRHAAIARLMGIRHFVLAVNKIDLVGHDEARFHDIVQEFEACARSLGGFETVTIPISALKGENLTARAGTMGWYRGPTLVEALEAAPGRAGAEGPLRFPIQRVSRPNEGFRGYQGTLASGCVRVGDAVAILPGGLAARIARIVSFDGHREVAVAGEAVTLVLDRDVDAARGGMVAAADRPPIVGRAFEASMVALQPQGIRPGIRYWLKAGARSQRVSVAPYALHDVADGSWREADALPLNAIGKARLAFDAPAVFDLYDDIRATGAFILIDPETNETVAGGMISGTVEEAASISRKRLTLALPEDLARRVLALDFVRERMSEIEVTPGP